jgi:hypothetical protein
VGLRLASLAAGFRDIELSLAEERLSSPWRGLVFGLDLACIFIVYLLFAMRLRFPKAIERVSPRPPSKRPAGERMTKHGTRESHCGPLPSEQCHPSVVLRMP